MARLNDNERNQVIGMLNAGASANCYIAALWLYSKDYRDGDDYVSQETLPIDPTQSGRPRMITAADDCYIVLQHLHNRRLIAAATGRQDGINPQAVRNQLRHSTCSCVPTVLQSNSHPTSSNGKAG